jgi:hypothetical protein
MSLPLVSEAGSLTGSSDIAVRSFLRRGKKGKLKNEKDWGKCFHQRKSKIKGSRFIRFV